MKKQITDWKIALIYTVIAGPILISPLIVYNTHFNNFLGIFLFSPLGWLILALLAIFMFIFGPYIASRIINNFFIISSVNKIILLSLLYFTIIVFIVLTPEFLFRSNDLLQSIQFISLNCIFYDCIFYLVSRMFIRSNNAENQIVIPG